MSPIINGSWLLLALVPLGTLIFAVAASPRWVSRSLSKHALWRLRDDVVDDVIYGRLDGHHMAVRELIARTEWAIEESRSFDLLHLLVWRRACRGLAAERLRKLVRIPDFRGLSDTEESRVQAYRRRYDSVAVRAMFLSSWLGLAIVLKAAVPVLLGGLKPKGRGTRIVSVVRVATDEVATETSIGHAAQDFVTIKGPDPEAVSAAPAVA